MKVTLDTRLAVGLGMVLFVVGCVLGGVWGESFAMAVLVVGILVAVVVGYMIGAYDRLVIRADRPLDALGRAHQRSLLMPYDRHPIATRTEPDDDGGDDVRLEGPFRGR